MTVETYQSCRDIIIKRLKLGSMTLNELTKFTGRHKSTIGIQLRNLIKTGEISRRLIENPSDNFKNHNKIYVYKLVKK